MAWIIEVVVDLIGSFFLDKLGRRAPPWVMIAIGALPLVMIVALAWLLLR